MYATNYHAPVGELTLASDGEKLLGLWIEGQKYFGGNLGELHPKADLDVFVQGKGWLDILSLPCCWARSLARPP